MLNRTRTSLYGLMMSGLLCGGLVVACSGSDAGSGFGNGGNGNGSGDDGGAGTLGGGNGGNGGNLGGGNGGTVGACAAESSKGQQQPLDIFIMLDQSGSMKESVAGGGDKWTAVTSALNTFVQSPLAGVSVGLQYFGLPASAGGGGGGGSCPTSCQTTADCGASGGPCIANVCIGCLAGGGGGGGFGADSCNAADYAKADVEIAPLPGVAAAITQSISKHNPTTATPTSAALQGAVDHAKAWAQAHPSDVVVALLATDGDPSECDTNLANIDAIAAAALNGTPKVLTFVIGVGSSLGNLNGIAAAGGTGSAFIVDTTQNANQQFLDALNKIRGAAVGCTYQIPLPKTGTPDFNKVNVQYTPGGGTPVIVPKVADKSHCPASGDAWYYDDNANPKQIILCDASCKKFTGDAHSQVDVLTGCQSVVK